MKDLMKRFLASIDLEDFESFDIDFDYCAWDSPAKKVFDMHICKETPWTYKDFDKFFQALQNIKYKYKISFTYKRRATFEEVIEFIKEHILSNQSYPFSSSIEMQPSDLLTNEIDVFFDDENFYRSSQVGLEDINSLLTFICYDFHLNPILRKQINEKEISEEEHQEILKDIDAKQENINKEYGDGVLKQMEAIKAYEAKMEERHRINRRGNYEEIDIISQIDSNSGNVSFIGYVFALEYSRYKENKPRITLSINDKHNGAIYVMFYMDVPDEEAAKKAYLHKKVDIRGCAYIDEYRKCLMIKGHFLEVLEDDIILPEDCNEHRVELHCHTKMSAMDGVSNMADYCKYASQLGMKAIGITDHGVVQGYPEAQKAAKDYNLKMLYGVEFYMILDEAKYIKNPSPIELKDANYVVLDLETTGLSSRFDKIIEFGAVKMKNGQEIGRIDILINPEMELSSFTTNLTHITNEMLKNQPTIKEAFPQILDFIKDSILVAHNAEFDIPFLNQKSIDLGYGKLMNPSIDTLWLARYLYQDLKKFNLGSLCKYLDVYYSRDDAHRADYDAGVTAKCFNHMLNKLTDKNEHLKHNQINFPIEKNTLNHLHPYHITAYAKNKEGIKDLFKLVSTSHIDYLAGFPKLPKIPKSVLKQYRNNLILGSACFNGEVFTTAREGSLEDLEKVISFYDFIEIQPYANYEFLERVSEVSSKDVIINSLKDIIATSDKLNKLICATGDVHYLSDQEKIFRDVYILVAEGVGKVRHPLNPRDRDNLPFFENPDQKFLSTPEMLEAMKYIVDDEKAKEIVITNTNKIADMVDDGILPVPNDHLYTPVIDNVDNLLRDFCFNNAHELYGDPLPKYIDERLNKELNGVIGYGYAVTYWIAHILVKRANDMGFMIGSRGSVGSSFAATMANITEVNPLPPHYRCPKCKHLEWTKETHPEIKSGFDLPEKVCPICGEKMIHDGQDIPFETFLGFAAEKVPDIDLNIPSNFQATTHKHCQEELGAENCFRAGTIETVAEKTAYGYAIDYLTKLGYDKESQSKALISYIANGCLDVKRTTGQHPGGIIVVPRDHEVYDFTPIQFPADDDKSDWKTTHFDFRSIHDTILKLDLLGHVDPYALKAMSDLTGVDIKTIPLNDAKVLSLFSSPDALNMDDNYAQEKTGALGIPEFGTSFVRGMLAQTQPKTVSDLIIISGLSHGTDVYLGNAETLIKEGVTDLRGVIGCRDDIMVYLMDKGLDPSMSFKIMEDVRKGKKVKPEYEVEMLAHNVPKYYIESCNKIKYMFPKGHATAYVTMALRVGYFKIYYPLEFYAVFFSLRSKQYDIKTMIEGRLAIIEKIQEIDHKKATDGKSASDDEDEDSDDSSSKFSNKDGDVRKTLCIALEMYQRGFKFANIDLYRSLASDFVVDHEAKALIPPFSVIDGLGDAAAQSVVDARKDGPFKFVDDLTKRTGLNKTNIDKLRMLGVLKDLPEKEVEQLDIFDFIG